MIPSDKIYTDEATLLRKTTEWLAPQLRGGIKVLRICDRYAKGYSDLFICARGRFVVAELKDDTGKPSPHQTLFIKDMIAAGATGGVCRTVKEVSDLINTALYCECTDYPKDSSHKFCPYCGKQLLK